MSIFYNKQLHKSNKEVIFLEDEAKHIIKVLRKKLGDKIFVTNGQGLKWNGLISSIGTKQVKVKKLKATISPVPKNNIHVAISLIKNRSRMEWFIEKATEIGVDEITPIICFNTESKNFNFNRSQKIMISAMKQSKRLFLPKLNPITTVKDFLSSQGDDIYIAHCHEHEKKIITQLESINSNVKIMIGPEGDFSVDEINLSINNGAIPISLGPNRLRTETAGILAINNFIIQKYILYGDY